MMRVSYSCCAALVPLAIVALALGTYPAHATIPSSYAQTTVPFNASLKSGSADITDVNPSDVRTDDPNYIAQQPHVTYINETAAMITWIDGNGWFYGTSPLNKFNIKTSLRLNNAASNGVKVTPFQNASYIYMFDNTPATNSAPGMGIGCAALVKTLTHAPQASKTTSAASSTRCW